METKVTAPISERAHQGDSHGEIHVQPQMSPSSDEDIKQSRISHDHFMRSQFTSPVENFDGSVNEKTSQTIYWVSSPSKPPSFGGRGLAYNDDGPDSSQGADYKPSPLRTWYMGITLAVITLLLCFTVVARRTLPDEIKTFASSVQIETTGNITRRNIGLYIDRDYVQHHPISVQQPSYPSASPTEEQNPFQVTHRVARPLTPTGDFISIGPNSVHPRGVPNPFTLPNPLTLPAWAPGSTQGKIRPSAIGRAVEVGMAQPTTPSNPPDSPVATQNDREFPQDRDLRDTLQRSNDTKSSSSGAAAPMTTPKVNIPHSTPATSSSSAIPTTMSPQPSSNTSSSSTSQNSPPVEDSWQVYDITTGEYFMGLILPTFLTTLLAIPLRSIEFNYKLYRPFHNLLHPNGATAAASLFLPTTGLSSFFADRDIITWSTLSLLALSAVLIPISAEAIHLNLHGHYCHTGIGDADGCAMTLGVSPTFAHLVMAILLLMGGLLVLTWTRLRRYRTAVAVKPWNVSFMEKFASDPMVSSMLSRLNQNKGFNDKNDHVRVFDPWTYTVEADGCRVIVLDRSSGEKKMSAQTRDSAEKSRDPRARNSKPTSAYSFILTLWGRILIMLILLGTLLTVLVYSQNSEDNGFERFMDSEKLGVRLLFSSTGVALTTLWTSFFQAVAWVSPYRVAGKAKVKTQRILDLSPPTNPFSGFYRVISGRHPDVYLGIVSFVSILSHMLPAILVNVPYRTVYTELYFLSCMWLVVAMISGMICTIIGSFFVDFPHMPIDPTTIAGAMYYATAGRTS